MRVWLGCLGKSILHFGDVLPVWISSREQINGLVSPNTWQFEDVFDAVKRVKILVFRSSVENKSYFHPKRHAFGYSVTLQKKVYTGTIGVSLMWIFLDNIVIEVIKIIQVMLLSTLICPTLCIDDTSPLNITACSTWNQHWRNKSSSGNGLHIPYNRRHSLSRWFSGIKYGFVLWRLVSLESSFPEKKTRKKLMDTSQLLPLSPLPALLSCFQLDLIVWVFSGNVLKTYTKKAKRSQQKPMLR